MRSHSPSLFFHFLSASRKRRPATHSPAKVRRRAFFEPLEIRTVLTAPVDPLLIGPGAFDHPIADLSEAGYLVVRTATSAEYDNQLVVFNDDADNVLITDKLLPFVSVGQIPGATLSADK